MKSSLGFLQILTLLIFIFNTIDLLNVNTFLMLFMVLVAWVDSYIEIGGEEDLR